jgi:hypothetical protein
MTEPTKPGFYWARWKHEDDAEWEPVELTSDGVSVIGLEELQDPDDFDWSREQSRALKAPRL